MNTVRVLNSASLWDNRVVKKQRRRFAFALAVLPLGAILLLAAGVAISASPGVPTVRVLADSARDAATEPVEPGRSWHPLVPEQSDLGDLLVNKITTPPPPPPADCNVMACVALTFDDGPNTDSTARILDALEREHVKATFFLVGNRVGGNATVVKRMYASGFMIGNHSWAHPDFVKLTAQQMQQQIDLMQSAIIALGLPAPTVFRPPYESRNNLMRQTIKLPTILWNVDPKDWHETDPNKIVATVEAEAKPGAIILMHDRPATADAARKIVHDLKANYRLVTVSELLDLQPDSTGEYFGR